MQNIEETLAAISFPEPPPAEPLAESSAAANETQPEATLTLPAEPAALEEIPVPETPVPAKKEPRKVVEEEEDEHAKDGVSLDELFAMKPEIFQTAGSEDEEAADGKKKGKKGKKKSVELVLDEERGEVIGRKKHKRGDNEFGEEE
jgi:N utilization substance protein A